MINKDTVNKQYLSCSVDKQTGVAVDAFTPAEVVVVSTVYGSNPDDSIHLLGKLPPLREGQNQCWLMLVCLNNCRYCVTLYFSVILP